MFWGNLQAFCNHLLSLLSQLLLIRKKTLGMGNKYFFFFLFNFNIVKISEKLKLKVLVAQSCPNSLRPVGCSPLGSSAHGIPQARILEWVAIAFSRWIFPTQRSNQGFLHCRQILYHLSHQGNPLCYKFHILFQKLWMFFLFIWVRWFLTLTLWGK